MDASPQWTQGTVNGVVEGVSRPLGVAEKKPRPPKEDVLNCPRCNSGNTKFCYYNNYSLSQPRYFCKTCRRYWTNGGSLRNVPVGGGSRKNRRSSSSHVAGSSSRKLDQPQSLKAQPKFPPQAQSTFQRGHDLSLTCNPTISRAYNSFHGACDQFVSMPPPPPPFYQNPNDPSPGKGFLASLNPMLIASDACTPPPVYSSTQEFRPGLNFSSDGGDNGYAGNLEVVQDHDANSSKILFAFQDLKTNDQYYNQERGEGESNGFWNGMLTGRGSW